MDDVLIEQVLVNLLDNAIKYTPAGSPLDIIATATEQNLTIEVADRGPGLPPGREDKVFEKFYQTEPGEGRGAGLGLAICQGIVRAHGGRIWAQNLPGRGVAFLFTLPLGAPSPAPGRCLIPSSSSSRTSHRSDASCAPRSPVRATGCSRRGRPPMGSSRSPPASPTSSSSIWACPIWTDSR